MRTQQEFQRKFPPESDCRKFYGGDLEKVGEAMKVFEKHNVDPRYVTKRIVTALTAKNPKTVYCDTWGTYLQIVMIRWMPLSWQDSFIYKTFLAQS